MRKSVFTSYSLKSGLDAVSLFILGTRDDDIAIVLSPGRLLFLSRRRKIIFSLSFLNFSDGRMEVE